MGDKEKITDDAVHNLILSELQDIKTQVDDVGTKVDDLKNKIYVGNGQTSLVDRINKNSLVTKVIVWCVSILYIAFVGGIVGLLFKS